jgi:hypothetical protein
MLWSQSLHSLQPIAESLRAAFKFVEFSLNRRCSQVKSLLDFLDFTEQSGSAVDHPFQYRGGSYHPAIGPGPSFSDNVICYSRAKDKKKAPSCDEALKGSLNPRLRKDPRRQLVETGCF